MAEYIDRAKFLKECIKTFGNPSLQIKAIENIAEKCTVDAVEVVRCKDCAVPHNKWTGCPHLNGLIPPPDHYCAKGERKEQE